MTGLRLFALALVALGPAGSPAYAQEPGTSSLRCDYVVVKGRVERGEAFERAFGPGLVFRLDPEVSDQNPPGWTIRVTPASDATSDYSMVVTPPYRFGNPRYVSTSYAVSAEEALSHSPRAFSFVAHDGAFEGAREALEVLLWPGTSTEAEVAAAEAAVGGIPSFDGRLWIEDGATSEPTSLYPRGAIELLIFRAELCVP